jgi:hypothetical protein
LSTANWLGQEKPGLGGGLGVLYLGCGPVDCAEPNGSLFDLVNSIGLCSSEWSKSSNRGAVGPLSWSAPFANQLAHGLESNGFCDVVVPSSAASTCTSCTSRTTTGAARARLMMERIRNIRAKVMYRRILVMWIRRRRCRSKRVVRQMLDCQLKRRDKVQNE